MTATHLQHIVHPASIGPNDKDPYNISNTSSSSNSSSPEPISSSTEGGVPNPFTMTAQTIANSGTTSMTVVHWGQQQQLQQQEQLNTAPVPLQTTSNSFASTNISGAMIASSGIQLPGITSTITATTTTTTPSVITSNPPVPTHFAQRSRNPITMRASSTSSSTLETGRAGGGALNHRRQKRLERNRESARLSRRRRKQYLEVLEDKVTLLSVEMDKGRREHVMNAIETLKAKRRETLLVAPTESTVTSVANQLSRASTELRVAATFQMQQQFSLSLPSHSKFLLWVTLQNDAFFRGGRANSERLSAARIGERMLHSGNDTAAPSQGMWPLLCHEVSLSYDQEEKVRTFQRTMLKTPESWLHRHTAAAASRLMHNTNENFQTMNLNIDTRERRILAVLNNDQRLKFLSWATENSNRISKKASDMKKPKENKDYFSISNEQHDAANLYILAHRMEHALNILPRPTPLVAESQMKRLSRRPSFESLGSVTLDGKLKDDDDDMSREYSFSSSGSLKRSLSDMSCDGGEERVQGMTSEEAQTAARPTIDAVLGFVKDIIPPPSFYPVAGNEALSMPPPPAKDLRVWAPAPHTYAPQPVMPMPVPSSYFVPTLAQPMQVSQSLPIIPSFLPHHLNIVPEESFLPGIGGDDFLFDLAEEDWAIGEGFDMDSHS